VQEDENGMEDKMRRNLRMARLRKGWSMERAAQEFGVGSNAIYRWEHGISMPYPHFRQMLCDVYELPAHELDLAEPDPVAGPITPLPLAPVLVAGAEPQPRLEALARQNLESRLQCVIYDWLTHKKMSWPLAKLQQRLSREIESYDKMSKQDHPNHAGIDEGRRAALRTLALIPLQAMGLGVVADNMKLAWSPQEFLTHCAAGITACYYLAKGQYEDMLTASDTITAYLPTLQTLVKESSTHRKEAANLVAQCWQLKALLAVRREGAQHAISYGQQVLTFAEQSGDPVLQLSAAERMIWYSLLEKQPGRVRDAILRVQSQLEHPAKPIPSVVQSMAYAGIARGQAFNHQKRDAFAATLRMHETFARAKDSENLVYLDYAGPFKYDGMVPYYLGQYNEAFEAFAKIIDPQTLTVKLPVSSERSRIDIINLLALTALKRSNKDKELIVSLWMAGMQGAKNLRSETSYEDAVAAYGIMEALWSDDARIRDLRDLMAHW